MATAFWTSGSLGVLDMDMRPSLVHGIKMTWKEHCHTSSCFRCLGTKLHVTEEFIRFMRLFREKQLARVKMVFTKNADHFQNPPVLLGPEASVFTEVLRGTALGNGPLPSAYQNQAFGDFRYGVCVSDPASSCRWKMPSSWSFQKKQWRLERGFVAIVWCRIRWHQKLCVNQTHRRCSLQSLIVEIQ